MNGILTFYRDGSHIVTGHDDDTIEALIDEVTAGVESDARLGRSDALGHLVVSVEAGDMLAHKIFDLDEAIAACRFADAIEILLYDGCHADASAFVPTTSDPFEVTP